MRFAALGLAVAVLGVSGCATVPVQVKGDTFCSIARRITWSKNDTSPTIDQVRRHNARYRRICG
jgi:starvation-inducible outer membrane lipoprotein